MMNWIKQPGGAGSRQVNRKALDDALAPQYEGPRFERTPLQEASEQDLAEGRPVEVDLIIM